MKALSDINFQNKKALVRVDFNVPLDEHFNVTDANRIEAAKPTIDEIITDGGSVICLLYTSPSPRDRTRSRMPSSA